MRVAVDSVLPRCGATGASVRPNVLMFGDWGVNCGRIEEQQARFRAWVDGLPRDARVAVVEVGAGTAVATIRGVSERLAAAGGRDAGSDQLRRQRLPGFAAGQGRVRGGSGRAGCSEGDGRGDSGAQGAIVSGDGERDGGGSQWRRPARSPPSPWRLALCGRLRVSEPPARATLKGNSHPPSGPAPRISPPLAMPAAPARSPAAAAAAPARCAGGCVLRRCKILLRRVGHRATRASRSPQACPPRCECIGVFYFTRERI